MNTKKNTRTSTYLSRHDEAKGLDGVRRQLQQPGGLALHHVHTALRDHGHPLRRRRRAELADGKAPRLLVHTLPNERG